ncbi:acyl-CoA thioesterase II [Necator americanus]|uniref:Acyl-CoA thioesterase II n=1 Tax=Necator americanus TaxID=51031 RepID=W2U130_NECAM|nr:acyl-CoA thioesterase II [Necator americanus]ETN87076.1 acyl-CoA thioesterase II [Necator americanus]
MYCEDEHEDYEDGEELSQGKEGLIAPHVMLEHVESFRKFAAERSKLSVPWSRMKTLFDEWIVVRQKESQVADPENLHDYLDRPESVLMHADFPVKPPSLTIYYGKKFGCPAGFGKVKELTDRIKEDHAGRQQCEKELIELEKAFLEKLEEFLVTNGDVLGSKQKGFVENKIKLIRKKMFPSQRASKTKTAKQTNGNVTRPQMSAFELFCQTKKDKYTDLSEEDRLRKLQKKFNKLPDDKREIFEKLALVKRQGVEMASGGVTAKSRTEEEHPPLSASNSISLPNVTYVDISSRAEDIQAGLIDTFLNLEKIDRNLFLARHLLKGRNSLPVVYGGQVIGQALSAAAATVDSGFLPNSLHSYFVQSGNVDMPILYMVDRIRDGKSFCTRLVKAVQSGDAIFTVQISFHRPEPDSIKHQLEMPKVAGPDGLLDWNQLMEEASKDPHLHPAASAMLRFKRKEIPPAFFRIFSFRPVDINTFLFGPMANGNNELQQDSFRSYIWIRANENIGDDPRIHVAAAAYISDATMIETAIRPHSRVGFIPSMALTLDHSIWMHNHEFRVDDWLLYENRSTIASGARTLIEGKLWTRDGRLVFSTAQEALIRAPKSDKPI